MHVNIFVPKFSEIDRSQSQGFFGFKLKDILERPHHHHFDHQSNSKISLENSETIYAIDL